MYPPSDHLRLSRNQLSKPPTPQSPQNTVRHNSQQNISSQFMPGDPGGFVLPIVPETNEYNSAPLGFMLPGHPNITYNARDGGWERNCGRPPLQPMCAGEPGGFIAPGATYPRPHLQQQHQHPYPPLQQQQQCPYPPLQQQQQYPYPPLPLEPQQQLSPTPSVRSRACSPEQYTYASRGIQQPQQMPPPPYSIRDMYPPSNSSVVSVAQSANNARYVPSRQGSVSSRLSAGSHRSAASPTMINAYPAHHSQHLQQPPALQKHNQQPTRPGPVYRWEDARFNT
ncbi:hypothetical protein COEREDRAFT_93422 [Coemansia reversa NRRL 1564]|uniref:Uncharacterized protein n=1 Tax=Coemansia reversa (strain ATCC 12441 / NRRL 1564) TaxID=763665 RepID=A0A2G5B893_COERN|nr:hypothetical protein COEREDRAFT_93422 [Coemansia reversa NRRL 1564]|eukprot:PIA15210.1 hypothetical protein COEREDRAFT_93422 [Coemansia reversa NRRL 1564]